MINLRNKKILLLVFVPLLLTSCTNKTDEFKFDEEVYSPKENISIENKELGYIFPKDAQSDNSYFRVNFNDCSNDYPVCSEYFEIKNKEYNLNVEYNITIYPAKLDNLNIKIKPVYREESSNKNLFLYDWSYVNIYNNNQKIGNVKYLVQYEKEISFITLEQYLKDNFRVMDKPTYCSLLTNDGDDASYRKNYSYVDFSTTNEDTFFNSLNLEQFRKYIYGERECFVSLHLLNYKNINLKSLTYKYNDNYPYSIGVDYNFYIDDTVVGDIAFVGIDNKQDIERIIERFLNN